MPEVRGSKTLVVWVGERDPTVAGPVLWGRLGQWEVAKKKQWPSQGHNSLHGPFVVSVCVALLSVLAGSYRLCTVLAEVFTFYTRTRTHKLQHAHTCSAWSWFGSASKDISSRSCSFIPPYRWIMGSKWKMRARPWACLLLFINGGAEQTSILTYFPVCWFRPRCAG